MKLTLEELAIRFTEAVRKGDEVKALKTSQQLVERTSCARHLRSQVSARVTRQCMADDSRDYPAETLRRLVQEEEEAIHAKGASVRVPPLAGTERDAATDRILRMSEYLGSEWPAARVRRHLENGWFALLKNALKDALRQ